MPSIPAAVLPGRFALTQPCFPSGLTLPPAEMQIAVLQRLRLPLTASRCGGRDAHGCGAGLGPHGPQQWLTRTTAPSVSVDGRMRLDLVVCGATALGGASCCDDAQRGASPANRE